MEEKDGECLDDGLRQEMEKCVEKLTMSGKGQLDVDVMKQFKKICKKSNVYVRHAFHTLMIQLEKNHAEVRLSTFQMIDELFNRSHEFRELLISQFQTFMELTVETDHNNPLPPPKAIAQKLKCETLKAVQQWHEKYGESYKKLSLGYHYLRTCKKVDFNDIRSRSIAERRRSEDRERKRQALMKIRLDRVLKEIEETSPELENSVTEVENCLELLLPAPDNFFICDNEEGDEIPSTSTAKQNISNSKPNSSSGNSDVNIKSYATSNNDTSPNLSDIVTKPNDTSANPSDTSASPSDISANPSDTSASPSDTSANHSDTSASPSNKSANHLGSAHKLEKAEQSKTGESISGCSSGDLTSVSASSGSNYSIGVEITAPSSDKHHQVLPLEASSVDVSQVGSSAENSSIIKCNSHNSGTKSVDVEEQEADEDEGGQEEEEESDDDDFEEVSGNEGFIQSYGLGSRQYNIDIDMRAVEAVVQETEDNKDIFNTVKDNICLIAIKYIPLVGQWLDILAKNGGTEADIKKMIDLKNRLINVKVKCDELKVIPAINVGKKRRNSDSDDGDDFEEVPEKEGYEPNIPAHLRAEYGLEPIQESMEERKKAPEKFMAQITPQFWSMSAVKSLTSVQDPTSLQANLAQLKTRQKQGESNTDRGQPSTSQEVAGSNASTSRGVTPSKKIRKDAPVVPFGADLAHWENPEKMEAPVMLKNDSFHKFWKPPEVENEKPNTLDMAALRNRAFHFTGTFEPVKWKCRAPMANGSLCERMDRYKCPFHGKVIPRDELGRPSLLNDALEIAKKAEKEAEEKVPDWQDPELMHDIQAATGLDLKVKGKGKGKGKGKKKKYGDLTDIEKIKNTSRTRLERKVFNASSVRRVNSRLDAADYRRIRDKFGNQFNYSLSQK